MERLGGFDFLRCPRTAFGAGELEVLMLREQGYLADLGVARVRRLPAKLVEAIGFVDGLLRERDVQRKEAPRGD